MSIRAGLGVVLAVCVVFGVLACEGAAPAGPVPAPRAPGSVASSPLEPPASQAVAPGEGDGVVEDDGDPPMTDPDCGVTEPDWKAAAGVVLAQAPERFPALKANPIVSCAPVVLSGQRVPYLFQVQSAAWRTWVMVQGEGIAPTGELEAARAWFKAQGAAGPGLHEWVVLGALIAFGVLPEGFRLSPIFNAEDQAAPLAWLRRSLGNHNPKQEALEVERSGSKLTLRLYGYGLGGLGGGGGAKADQLLRLTVVVDGRGELKLVAEEQREGRFRARRGAK